MTTIRLKENEPFEVAMRRFKRTIEKTGLLTELRAREFYEKPMPCAAGVVRLERWPGAQLAGHACGLLGERP